MTNGQDNSTPLPRPAAMGKAVRLAVGIALLFFFAQVIRQTPAFLAVETRWRIPGGEWWIAAIGCFWALPRVVNDGLGRAWGHRPQWVYLAMVLVAAGSDLLIYKALWAKPLGMLVLLMVLYVFGFAGISFLVAALAAVPG